MVETDRVTVREGVEKKVVYIHDRERKTADFLGMTLQDFLKRKAVLLEQVRSLGKRKRKCRGLIKPV